MAVGTEHIQFNITALDKTQAAFASVQKGMSGIEKTAATLMSKFGGLQGIIASAFGAASISGIIQVSEQLSKLSLRTGSTVEELSKLRYIANQSDTDLNALAVGSKFLQKNLVEAAQGSKQAREAFSQIGINFRDIIGLRFENQITVIGEAISRLDTEAQRTAASLAIFGKQGTELLPIFEGGASAIKKTAADAEKMGIVFSGFASKNIKEMNDAFARVTDSLLAFGQKLIGYVAPAITALVDVGVKGFNFLADIVVKVFGGAVFAVTKILSAFLGAFELGAKALAKLKVPFAQDIADGLADANKSLNAFSDDVFKSINTQKKFNNELDKTNKALGKISKPTIGLEKKEDPQEKEKSMEKLAKVGEKVNNVFRDAAIDGVRDFGRALKDLMNGTEDAGASFEKFALRVINSIQDIIMQMTIIEPIENSIRDAFKGGGGFGDIIGSLFGGGGGSSWDGMAASMGNFGGAFADGGSFGAGKPILVGERGPEMMIPNRSGSVIPNDQLGGNGMTINQTINISTGVQQTVRAEIMSMMPKIAAQTKAAVADARMRGGGFASAMGT